MVRKNGFLLLECTVALLIGSIVFTCVIFSYRSELKIIEKENLIQKAIEISEESDEYLQNLLAEELGFWEIGRASCRERVYVLV